LNKAFTWSTRPSYFLVIASAKAARKIAEGNHEPVIHTDRRGDHLAHGPVPFIFAGPFV